MQLTEREIKHARPAADGSVRRLSDGHGLFLQITPDGSKYWRYGYTLGGRRRTISLGVYPGVGLADVRIAHLEALRAVKSGTDPAQLKARAQLAAALTFKDVVLEWLKWESRRLDPSTHAATTSRVNRYLVPPLGALSIAAITTEDLWNVTSALDEKRGGGDTVHRVGQHIAQIMRFAKRTGRLGDRPNPAAELRGSLSPLVVKHFARLTDPDEVGALLYALDTMEFISPYVRAAVQVMAYCWPRPGALRKATWSEFDLDRALWTIPGAHMKRTNIVGPGESMPDHLVPLSRQAVKLLRELRALPASEGATLAFHSPRSKTRPLSDNTMNVVLRRLGYDKGQMTAHGFRGIASTMLRERPLRYPNDVIELQLAHVAFKGEVRSAYDSAELVDDRAEMMQAWADHLDGLKLAHRERARARATSAA